MTLPPIDTLLVTIVLATLSIGLPIVTVLAIRFLWERKLTVGRSKELEKLIWQLHRIASALEQHLNLSFPPVQPGTEEPRDLIYLKQAAAPSQTVAAPNAAEPVNSQTASPGASQAAAAATAEARAQDSPAPQSATQAARPAARPRQGDPGAERARVNSMFGFDR
jgi:hypothetical protein